MFRAENLQNTQEWSFEDQARAFNRKEGDLQGYECPICKNKGVVMEIKDGVLYTRECDCMKIRYSMQRIEKSGLKDLMEKCNFENFKTDEDFQKAMKKAAISFCEQKKGWFYIGGQPGCGKTHVCTAVAASYLNEGKEVMYLVWSDVSPLLKALKMREGEYQKEIEKYKRIPVLYIDDFLKTRRQEPPTDADINIAFELINARYNDREKITIISSEWTVQEIMDFDEGLGSRIYASTGNYKLSISRNLGKNYRLK